MLYKTCNLYITNRLTLEALTFIPAICFFLFASFQIITRIKKIFFTKIKSVGRKKKAYKRGINVIAPSRVPLNRFSLCERFIITNENNLFILPLNDNNTIYNARIIHIVQFKTYPKRRVFSANPYMILLRPKKRNLQML